MRNNVNIRVCILANVFGKKGIRDRNTVKTTPFFASIEYFVYAAAEVYFVFMRFQRVFAHCFPRAFQVIQIVINDVSQ